MKLLNRLVWWVGIRRRVRTDTDDGNGNVVVSRESGRLRLRNGRVIVAEKVVKDD